MNAQGKRVERELRLRRFRLLDAVEYIMWRETVPEYDEVPVDPDIPDVLKVPGGHMLFLRTYGRGAQIYTCPETWDPAPFAVLHTNGWDKGEIFAVHYGGPIWEAIDGSVFIGDITRQQSVVSPDSDSVPWLLIPAKATKGNGLMSRVTYIQRVRTKGGKAPTSSCVELSSGAQFLIAYAAEYLFYVASDQQAYRFESSSANDKTGMV
jgi:uncharacterized protein DUF3455